MVGNYLKALFWVLQRTLLLQKLNLLKLQCITLASIVDTLKIQKYYLQKFNLAVVLSASNNFYKRKVHNTGDSQVVTHQGTNPARHCLTSVIR